MDASNVKIVGVVGAGQMGAGIAQIAASAGMDVLLADTSIEVATRAKEGIAKQLAKLVAKGKLDAAASEATLARIRPLGETRELEPADFVVEAATENTELKIRILKSIDASLRPEAVLATNTSSISITRLAAATQRPSAFIGMHFMNPVPLMKLVEVVRGVSTSSATLALTQGLAARLGKTVITSNDHPGFLVNRILIPFLNEACFTVQEGAGTMEDVDRGARLGLNHPMGPFELADLIGLDTVLAIAEVLHRELGDPKYRPATNLKNLVAAGWLGKKTRRGFYEYDESGQRTASATGDAR